MLCFLRKPYNNIDSRYRELRIYFKHMSWHGETCRNKGGFSCYFLPTPETLPKCPMALTLYTQSCEKYHRHITLVGFEPKTLDWNILYPWCNIYCENFYWGERSNWNIFSAATCRHLKLRKVNFTVNLHLPGRPLPSCSSGARQHSHLSDLRSVKYDFST